MRVFIDFIQKNLGLAGKKKATPIELSALFQTILLCMSVGKSISFVYKYFPLEPALIRVPEKRMQELFTAFDVAPKSQIREMQNQAGEEDRFFLYEMYDGATALHTLEAAFATSQSELFFVTNASNTSFDDLQGTGKGKQLKLLKVFRRMCRAKKSIFGFVFETAAGVATLLVYLMRLRRMHETPVVAMEEVINMLCKQKLEQCVQINNVWNIDRDYFDMKDCIDRFKQDQRKINLTLVATCKLHLTPFTSNPSDVVLDPGKKAPEVQVSGGGKYLIPENGPFGCWVAVHEDMPEFRCLAYRTGKGKLVLMSSMSLYAPSESGKCDLEFFGEPNEDILGDIKGRSILDLKSYPDDESSINGRGITGEGNQNQNIGSDVEHQSDIDDIDEAMGNESIDDEERYNPDDEKADSSESEGNVSDEDPDEPALYAMTTDEKEYRIFLRELKNDFLVLTVTQRTADWFLMRLFRVTGTGADIVKTLANKVRQGIITTDAQMIEYFATNAWFMKRYDQHGNHQSSKSKFARQLANGKLYEDSIVYAGVQLIALKSREKKLRLGEELRAVVFEPPMLGLKEKGYIAMSGDALLKFISKRASFEAKFCDSDSLAERCRNLVKYENGKQPFISLSFDDPRTKKWLHGNEMQCLHQALVLNAEYGYYARADSKGLIYVVELHFPSSIREEYLQGIERFYDPCFKWFYEGTDVPELESYGYEMERDTFVQHVQLARSFEKHIRTSGYPEYPLKCFKPKSSFCVNKNKHAVDTFTKVARDIRIDERTIQSPGQRLSLTYFTGLTSNGNNLRTLHQFYSSRRFAKMTGMEDWSKFKDTNQVLSFSAFCLLLSRSDAMFRIVADAFNRDTKSTEDMEGFGTPGRRIVNGDKQKSTQKEESRKKKKAFKGTKKNKRTVESFWDKPDGLAIRSVGTHCQKSSDGSRDCIVCTVKADNARNCTGTKCSQCEVPLCKRIRDGNKYSCFVLFHSEFKIAKIRSNRSLVEAKYEDLHSTRVKSKRKQTDGSTRERKVRRKLDKRAGRARGRSTRRNSTPGSGSSESDSD